MQQLRDYVKAQQAVDPSYGKLDSTLFVLAKAALLAAAAGPTT